MIIPGLALGLVSSFHCVGMCGPIAFVLPVQGLSPAKKLPGILLYNFGRVFTYTLLGLFFGLIGQRIFIAGFQQWFSVLMGVLILIMMLSFRLKKKLLHVPVIDRASLKLQAFIVHSLHKQQRFTLFTIGAANGLLPCGMVYFAVAGALATGSVEGSTAFMAAFGLGTMPLMILLSQFGVILSLTARNFMKKLVPYFLASMAVLLILRGLNLNIPYISPFFSNHSADNISCH